MVPRVVLLCFAFVALSYSNTRIASQPAEDLKAPSTSAEGTRLLYRALAAQPGFDAEITIANGSEDPGTCRLTYFSAGRATGAAVSTPVIEPGREITLKAPAGFQGSAVASCTFTKARGVSALVRIDPAATATNTTLFTSL